MTVEIPIGQIYTLNGVEYVWTGTEWKLKQPN